MFHDAFHYDPGTWNDLFDKDDVDKVAMDHHYYQAWYGADVTSSDQFCQSYYDEVGQGYWFNFDVWFGEWALATDVCAHWLGGFNDGNTDPQRQCYQVDCPTTYIDVADFDRSKDVNGPFGTGNSDWYNIHSGKCTTDSDYFPYEDV